MGKNQHVVPVENKWGIRCEGNSRLTRVFNTHKEAIEEGREIAINKVSYSFTVPTEELEKGTVTETIYFLRKVNFFDSEIFCGC
ncbi:MAG: DUF2188 domain-containing protein [Syntrophales bacterium]|nr:DUF2188 domain-containing protein [Syntrophales bacterium]